MVDMIAGFCAAVLLYAAIAKADVFFRFVESLAWIARSRRAATALARGLIATEVILGLGLLLPFARAAVASAAATLMVGFTIILLYAALRRTDARCMCFGDSPEPVTGTLVLRDAGLAGLLLVVSVSREQVAFALVLTGVGVFLLVAMLGALRTTLKWARAGT